MKGPVDDTVDVLFVEAINSNAGDIALKSAVCDALRMLHNIAC